MDGGPGEESRGDTFLLTLLAEDPDAGFELLVREYELPLRTVAVRVCGVRSDADDLCAEALTRAYFKRAATTPGNVRGA